MYGQTTSRKEAVRTYCSIAWTATVTFSALQGHSGGNKDDPSLQDNVEIPYKHKHKHEARLKRTGPRQNPNSQSLLVSFMMKLGCRGPQQMARPPCANSTVAKPVDEARLPEPTAQSATEDTDDPEEWDESEEEKYFCSMTRAEEENWAARIIRWRWRWARKRMWTRVV